MSDVMKDLETIEAIAVEIDGPLWESNRDALLRLAALVRSILPTLEVAEAMKRLERADSILESCCSSERGIDYFDGMRFRELAPQVYADTDKTEDDDRASIQSYVRTVLAALENK